MQCNMELSDKPFFTHSQFVAWDARIGETSSSLVSRKFEVWDHLLNLVESAYVTSNSSDSVSTIVYQSA
ncbi:hypothetical protein Pelo_19205 [Pelomyxa schiedti]|nr:hypothetical protein Pelo_19205 [Pelomyxa schiedti]